MLWHERMVFHARGLRSSGLTRRRPCGRWIAWLAGLCWIRTNHSEPTRWAVNPVSALRAIRCGWLCFLKQLPNSVLAGGWEARMVHEWIRNLTRLSAALNAVLS